MNCCNHDCNQGRACPLRGNKTMACAASTPPTPETRSKLAALRAEFVQIVKLNKAERYRRWAGV